MLAVRLSLCLLAAFLSQNAQAIVAKDTLGEDVAFKLELGEQAWLALLEMPGGVFCSGTIVSPTSILSAALCLKAVENPTHGTAYAGNVKYTEPKDFDPPTQNRSIVEYHFYDSNNTLIYDIMLVKIDLKWTWSKSVQPIGIIEQERLSPNFVADCYVSGLGDDGSVEGDKVARSVSVRMSTWRTCTHSPQEQRMCFADPEIFVLRAGDGGGPVVCDIEPKDKLYGIISECGQSKLEEQLDPYRRESHEDSFQYLGFYASWIKKTAGDILSDEEVKAIREQHQQEFPVTLSVNGMFLRNRNEPSEAGVPDGPGPGGVANATLASSSTTQASSGAAAVAVAASHGAALLLALLLAAAFC